MPRNGSGTYTLPQAPFVAGTVISSAAVNSDLSDIASALTGSLPRDGQAGMTGQLKLPDGSSSTPGLAFTNEVSTGFSRVTTGTIGVDILGAQIATITSAGWVGPVSGSIPVGCVLDFTSNAIPAQWIACYGQAISRTTYVLLFNVLGTFYGAGDGSTTFNIPDLRGQTIFAPDNMGGTPAGRLVLTYFGSNPNAVGSLGGGSSITLGTSNLPAYTPSGSVANGAITTTTPFSGIGGSTSFFQNGTAAGYNVSPITITSSQAASSFTGNAQGGSSVAFSRIPPGFTLNKIIFAGA